MAHNILVKTLLGFGLFGLALFVSGCQGGKNQTNIELIQDMMDQKNIKSQDFDEIRKEPGNRVPPPGTVPMGFKPYPYAGDALKAEANLVNPFAKDFSEKFMARGQEQYRVYCGICHGVKGAGDGTIAQYLALKPPPLTSEKVRGFKDGRIYHIITDGQGVMSSYATQIHNTDDRWAIVNYIRALQKAN